MGTAIKQPVPDRVKPSSVMFDIRALWRSALIVRVLGCQKLQMTYSLTRSGACCFQTIHLTVTVRQTSYVMPGPWTNKPVGQQQHVLTARAVTRSLNKSVVSFNQCLKSHIICRILVFNETGSLFPDAGVLNGTTNFTVQVPDPAKSQQTTVTTVKI